ncbi:hypothetical protein [Phenylobacterium sp. 58.2.17]|uniref:hypothetical protein n=1 Tax=Phenylobacterium sp. 58.2.17 TaxID=2969306 RepID=UPI002265406F|nr:hypothetical protein [Phenylobacterium sp. 58.2.17]MCX7585762.1 hypothetical protein [Phenylobacterium sp. 58.2.17]
MLTAPWAVQSTIGIGSSLRGSADTIMPDGTRTLSATAKDASVRKTWRQTCPKLESRRGTAALLAHARGDVM